MYFENQVFYVDEKKDDFTFYLAKDKDNTVINNLSWNNLKNHLKSGPTNKTINEEFSFSEKIAIKRLESIPSEFWQDITAPASDPQYACLRQKILKMIGLKINHLNKGRQTVRELKKIVEKLKKKSLYPLDESAQELLRPFVISALNSLSHGDSLTSEPWYTNLKFDKEEKKILAAFNNPYFAATQRKWTNPLIIENAFKKYLKWQTEIGRALICFSYAGEYLSITFRKLKAEGGYNTPEYNNQTKRRKNLFSLNEYYSLLYEEIFVKTKSNEHAQGLLVVTGSTNSAKSEITRGLIYKYLKGISGRTNEDRNLHLVTFEDPIEKLYAEPPENDGQYHPFVSIEMPTGEQHIDYTPREKDKDVSFLEKSLEDALRQTPAVLFVGETRNKKEWELLLDFAATGHLIVTTAHAGSLVEAMHKIFEARGVKTPADRSEIANKLLAVIHLRGDKFPHLTGGEKPETTNALFPALWRRTPRGIASLTSNGLASLLPHQPGTGKNNNAPSCIGRRWFIKQLVGRSEPNLINAFSAAELSKIKNWAYKKATKWDLEGV